MDLSVNLCVNLSAGMDLDADADVDVDLIVDLNLDTNADMHGSGMTWNGTGWINETQSTLRELKHIKNLSDAKSTSRTKCDIKSHLAQQPCNALSHLD